MKASDISDELEQHSQMLDIMGSSIKKCGKKLHNLELMLHNEPLGDDYNEKRIWQEKMNKLMKFDTVKRFPTLKEVKAARIKAEKLANTKTLSKSRSHFDDAPRSGRRRRIPPASLQKLQQSRQLKDFERKHGMGPPPENEVLRTIKNYSGANSVHFPVRHLIRKDGRLSRVNVQSAVPQWVGPGHYRTGPSSLASRPESSYRAAFKSTSRERCSAESIKSELLLHRSTTSLPETQSLPSYAMPRTYTSALTSSHLSDMTSLSYPTISPWSRESAASTLGHRSVLSSRPTPARCILSPHLNPSTISPFLTYLEESSSVISQTEDSESNYNSGIVADLVSTSSVDSLLVKMSAHQSTSYKVKDYTMGALRNQRVLLTDDNLIVDTDSVCGSTNASPSSPVPEATSPILNRTSSFGADIPPPTGIEASVCSQAERLRDRLSRERTAKRTHRVNNKDIPLTESVLPEIHLWRHSNSDIYLPSRPSTTKYLKDHRTSTAEVNIMGLLLDDAAYADVDISDFQDFEIEGSDGDSIVSSLENASLEDD